MKIEPPAAIIGGEYKEGAVVKLSLKNLWRNRFKRDEEVQEEKELLDYYDITPIDETNAVYRLIIGQRSNRQDIQRLQTHC